MEKVEFNKSNENPFNGLKYCLELQQSVTDAAIPTSLLDNAWKEVKTDKQKRELFFSILFSIGDITNRQHNIFHNKKVDNGGNANRETFYHIVQWLWKNNKNQFITFLNEQLFNEYVCFDVLYRNRIKSTTKGQVIKVYSAFQDPEYVKVLLDYTYSIVNGSNPFNKMLVAKFLTIPRLSNRQNHKKLLPETKKIMSEKAAFIHRLSQMMCWETTYFKGYREWRKQYNGDLESVLFTTGKINEFTKDEFISWFDKLPALARSRVTNRIKYSVTDSNPKWSKFQPWVEEWANYKEEKQQEQRLLEEKIRQGQASEEDKQRLKEVQKEAKVNIGATNFNTLYNDIVHGSIDKLKLESFINKVNLPYNSLVIIDDSGSMRGAPFNFAKFIASVCLVKNPDDDARNLIGFFNSTSHWHSYIDKTSRRKNSILTNTVSKTTQTPLVDPKLSFYDNYKRISSFCDAVFQSGGTHLDSIPEGLKSTIERNPQLLDELKNYPIWTICSDGDLNNSCNARESMLDFQERCKEILGYVPFVVMIEITNYNNKRNNFVGVENMIYIPANPAQIEQFLTNFKDSDLFDTYMPLLSIYRSNRYELVRQNTL